MPGDTVRPADELFVLRLTSETLQSSQTELFKGSRELQINREQKERLSRASGSVPKAKLLERDYQERRLAATLKALRQDLTARGLSAEQIQAAGDSQFLTSITVRVPGKTAASPGEAEAPLYEVEELKVQLGEQVQAGQLLCAVSNH